MINDVKTLRFFELVLKPCALTYGVAPCTAALGVTGTKKCYNSPRTCQDPAHYSPGAEQIIRWAEPTADLPIDIEVNAPCVTGINRRPQMIEPGEGLGVRESVTVTMHNFKHNDSGFDKYLSTRGYNTYNSGTYWGKFFARWGSLQGYEARTVDGLVGQTLDEMERRYYVVESTGGPDSAGNVSFVIKDIIKFMDSDKAMAPSPSLGVLDIAIDETDTSFTLVPAGVGNAYYPTSGLGSIGDEVVNFNRVGDSISLTGRALRNSKLDSHNAGETLQIALTISSKNPAYITNLLLSNYTDTPPEYLDLGTWEAEMNTYVGRLYSADVMKPTPVKTLITELVREVGLIFYTDLAAKKIALQALRPFVPTLTITDDYAVAGSISSKPLSDKRVSDVWVYYGKRNPLEKQDEKKNYASIYVQPTQNPVVALENNPRAIREILCRWITVFNSPAASAIAQSILSRYETIPRQVSFKVPPFVPISQGQAINVSSRIFEDSQGQAAAPFQCQVIAVSKEPEGYSALAEEVIFTQIPPPVDGIRIINITENTFNINLRDVHDTIYTPAESGDTIRLLINSNVIVGSVSLSTFSLNIGSWPTGVIIEIGGLGRIQAKGGDGAIAYASATSGGTALYTRYPIKIISNLQIFGGGGGSGKVTAPFSSTLLPGAGGAGQLPGAGSGTAATTEHGGSMLGTAGGDPGLPGMSGATVGGGPGKSIDGVSFVTITGSPDIRGPQIN